MNYFTTQTLEFNTELVQLLLIDAPNNYPLVHQWINRNVRLFSQSTFWHLLMAAYWKCVHTKIEAGSDIANLLETFNPCHWFRVHQSGRTVLDSARAFVKINNLPESIIIKLCDQLYIHEIVNRKDFQNWFEANKDHINENLKGKLTDIVSITLELP